MRIAKPVVCALAGAVLIVQGGCGTLLHPERKGQGPGRLDPSIVILDGIGLFFFLIPGLIAFAIDISNGTIYLPGGGGSGDARADAGTGADGGYRKIALDGPFDAAALEAFVERELGVANLLARADLEVRAADAAETIAVRGLAPR